VKPIRQFPRDTQKCLKTTYRPAYLHCRLTERDVVGCAHSGSRSLETGAARLVLLTAVSVERGPNGEREEVVHDSDSKRPES
jgi:hypothetical protein